MATKETKSNRVDLDTTATSPERQDPAPTLAKAVGNAVAKADAQPKKAPDEATDGKDDPISSVIYIQSPVPCSIGNSQQTRRQEGYPFVVDCLDLLNELSAKDAADFVATLGDVINGYDGADAYIMPELRIVVTNEWRAFNSPTPELIEATKGYAKRMISLAKINCRVKSGTRPAISPAG